MTADFAPLIDPTLDALPGIRHGFFTRQGGVSKGLYCGLNTGLGSRDDPTLVRENRARIRRHLGGTAFLTVHQHHSAICIRTRAPWHAMAAPRADAIVTSTPGLVIVAQAADCGPILFADPEAGVIGAAHAGWKGALNGIAEATVAAMEAEGAKRQRIRAVLGPSISAAAYEVGPEFVPRFTDADPDNAIYFTASAKEGHAYFDLPRYTLDRLKRAGVSAHNLGRCTYAEPELFVSYRRATHRNEEDYGRLDSAIMLA